MADEFQSGICSGNWWNSERIISTTTTTTTGGISSQLPFTTASSDVINIGGGNTNNYGGRRGGGGGGGGGWQHEQEEQHQMKAISCRSSDESGGASVTCSSSVVFQDTNNNNNNLKPQESDSIGGSGNSILMDSTLQMMGYGLSSSPSMDWNPSLLNNNQSSSSGRSDHNNFGCMLQEDLTSSRTTTTTNNIYRHHQEPGAEVLILKDWSPKNFSSSCSTTTGDQDSSISVVNGTFQQHNIIQQGGAGFSLDQHQHHHHHPSNNHLLSSTTSSSECTVTCDQGLPTSFPMDHSSTLYGCPSSFLQGLFEPDYQSSTTPQSVPSSFPSMANSYFMNTNDQLPSPSWPAVVPKLPRHQFLKNTTTISSSLPKQIQQPSNNNNQLHFSNNARFWNANSVASMNNSRSSFFPSQQIQLLTPPTSYEEKPNCSNQNPLKNKVNSSSTVKKSSSNEPSFKRPRVETPSPLPTFKVRKEKLGDRITALQQLVSPFGKTDTASVLFEAIEYIKFLHDQVTVLSAPYLKNGAHIQHHQQMQNSNKTKEAQGSTTTEKDLRSRGLCLVPISSTFPVTNETATDFWTPTFGGTYR